LNSSIAARRMLSFFCSVLRSNPSIALIIIEFSKICNI
jgi:hypothetical protein